MAADCSTPARQPQETHGQGGWTDELTAPATIEKNVQKIKVKPRCLYIGLHGLEMESTDIEGGMRFCAGYYNIQEEVSVSTELCQCNQ